MISGGQLNWRVTIPCAFVPLFALLLSPARGSSEEYREYYCIPDTQHECARGQCKKITDGFQHAESFAYNTKTSELSACLWTNCYAATVAILKNAVAGTIMATGKLKPTAHPGSEPVIVSLTIQSHDDRDITGKKAGDFNAVWGYGDKGLTLDMGKCELRKLP